MADSVSEYRKAQADLVRLAERELDAFWRTLDHDDALKTTKALELFVPELVQAYGDVGAAVASDFYEELREAAGVKGRYRADISDSVNPEAIRASTKWAVGPLFQSESDIPQALANLSQVTDRFVKQHGRNTLDLNIRRDPAQVRYARVPTGKETCAFCLVLASRGAVYSKSSASNDMNKYHGLCDCVPTPVFSDADLDRLKEEEGYDSQELTDLYDNAVSQSDRNVLKGHGGILQALREQQGIR